MHRDRRRSFGKSHRPSVWPKVVPGVPVGGTMSTQPYVFSCDDCYRYAADPDAFQIGGDLSSIRPGDYDLPVDVLDIPEVTINAPSGRLGGAMPPGCRFCGCTNISLRLRRRGEYPPPGHTHQPLSVRPRISRAIREYQKKSPPKRGKGGRFV
jgi:hypothetical protein